MEKCLYENVLKERITPELNLELFDLIANMLDKPKEYCAVHKIPDQLMSFGGSFDPCAQIVLLSIEKLGLEENKNTAKYFQKN